MKAIKTIVPLLISSLLAGCVAVCFTRRVQYAGIVEDLSSWNSFFNVFGVIYAIVAGFLLLTVLNRYSALSQVVEDELNAVESIRDFLVYFREDQLEASARMKRALARYASSLSESEWEQMGNPATVMNSDTSEELYELMRSGKAIRAKEPADKIALSAIVESTSEVAKLRTRRIALSNERLPPRLRMLMLFMSVVLAVGFAFLGVQSATIHVFILVAVVVSLHLIYMIIVDLDHPFYGVWNLDKAPLEELVARFEADLASGQALGDISAPS